MCSASHLQPGQLTLGLCPPLPVHSTLHLLPVELTQVSLLCVPFCVPVTLCAGYAQVRYRASWGWPNYLDAQAVGWDEGLFGRWLIDGQLHLSARVRVLG